MVRDTVREGEVGHLPEAFNQNEGASNFDKWDFLHRESHEIKLLALTTGVNLKSVSGLVVLLIFIL